MKRGLLLGALGVVYGDIGTSPLYALNECFQGHHPVSATRDHVIGLVSVFVWALLVVVVIKYIVTIMRADNQGEGGILALLSLSLHRAKEDAVAYRALIIAGVFGAALLFNDGMLTPVVSILGALEGLPPVLLQTGFADIATLQQSDPKWIIIGVTLVILTFLFGVQNRGTERMGRLFGPVMLVWFITLAGLGLPAIAKAPDILNAFNPYHAAKFLLSMSIPKSGIEFWVLGSVVLCFTGAEALYADMGHFGRAPIRQAWFFIVFPCLIINYLGQAALVLKNPAAASTNLFYALAPGKLLIPLVIIATAAAVVASQALISGAFSIARNAIQLGFIPRLNIVHTSSATEGQIYLPQVNWTLYIACVILCVVFQSATGLAAAYGIAVTGTMVMTTYLFYFVAREWWGTPRAVAVCVLFMAVDVPFLFANFDKLGSGGWVPVASAAVLFVMMMTWKAGRRLIGEYMKEATIPIEDFLKQIEEDKIPRVRGTAVFMTSSPHGVPPVLLHHFKHTPVLHTQIAFLTIVTEHVPTIPRKERVQVERLGEGFFRVIVRYGFMQTPRVTDILKFSEDHGLHTDRDTTSFFLGREKLVITKRKGLARWRKVLFAVMSRNARPVTDFYRIPVNRVVEVGMQVEI